MSLDYQLGDNVSDRQHWMAVLANANFQDLYKHWQALNLDPVCEIVRGPEVGLAKLQGRIGGTGERFNVADTLISRATIRLQDGTLGFAYLRGRAKQHALLAAMVDALLQQTEHGERLMELLIKPLFALQEQVYLQKQQKAATSKVDFFTLIRGED